MLTMLSPGEAPEIQFLSLDTRKPPWTGNSLLVWRIFYLYVFERQGYASLKWSTHNYSENKLVPC